MIANGRGIKSVTAYYLNNATAPTVASDATAAQLTAGGWSTTLPATPTSTTKYTWKVLQTIYSDDTIYNSVPERAGQYVAAGTSASYAIVTPVNGRTLFTDADPSNIELKATMYVGSTEKTATYKWASIPAND